MSSKITFLNNDQLIEKVVLIILTSLLNLTITVISNNQTLKQLRVFWLNDKSHEYATHIINKKQELIGQYTRIINQYKMFELHKARVKVAESLLDKI